MNRVEEICKKYNIALCYIFGSQREMGKSIVLEGKRVEMIDPESDIDFAVLFTNIPENI